MLVYNIGHLTFVRDVYNLEITGITDTTVATPKMKLFHVIWASLVFVIYSLFLSLWTLYPCMRIGNNFTQVCLSLCPSVCLCVQAITFELLQLGTLFSVYRYILTTSRSSSSIKVIGSRSRSNVFLSYFTKTVNYMCFIPLRHT